jgi:hypothetical protein
VEKKMPVKPSSLPLEPDGEGIGTASIEGDCSGSEEFSTSAAFEDGDLEGE